MANATFLSITRTASWNRFSVGTTLLISLFLTGRVWAQPSLSDTTGRLLNEVTVTAEKQETLIQRTPVAVSVLNARQLRDYRIWNIQDLAGIAPNFFVGEHAGSTGANFINIRGTIDYTTDESVATYVDGVYQFGFYAAPLQFLNVERVEVLRGPQGTLYGRNAQGGVLSIITRQGGNHTTGFAELSLGNVGQQRYLVSISTPLVANRLFLSAGVLASFRNGFYTNPTLKTDNFDRHENYAANLNLRYIVTNRLTLGVSLKTGDDTDHGAYPWVLPDSLNKGRRYTAFGNFLNTERRRNTTGALTVGYASHYLRLTATTTFQQFRLWYPDRYDVDLTGLDLLSATSDGTQHNYTQEIRLTQANADARLRFTTGLFFYNQQAEKPSTFFYGPDAVIFDKKAPYQINSQSVRDNRGLALFGQATYGLSRDLDLTLGLRYDTERRQLNTEASTYEKTPAAPTRLGQAVSFRKIFTAVTPRATLSWKTNGNVLVYATYGRGFRAGGFNSLTNKPEDIPYNQEFSDNYEIGLKTTSADNRLRINLTGYLLLINNQQTSIALNANSFLIQNAGRLRNPGVELEVSALPVRGLQLDWNASLSDPRYLELPQYDAASKTNRDYAGNRPLITPRITSFLAAQYNRPISKTELTAFVRGDWRYVGETFFDLYNAQRQAAYGLLNTRIGITTRHLDAAFWVRNVANVGYYTWGSQTPGQPYFMQSPPRTLGVTLTAKI